MNQTTYNHYSPVFTNRPWRTSMDGSLPWSMTMVREVLGTSSRSVEISRIPKW